MLAVALSASPAYALGTVMVAGGGSEGDIGDTSSWSYRLYARLIEAGDVNGDGQITVAIIASSNQSEFIPQYFEWLGATDAFNVIVPTRNAANNSAIVDRVRGADAVFIKGGDQGVYYDLWNGTRLEDNIRYVAETLSGGVGGTSAGAMSQSQYALAGSQDLVSLDVLTDAQTRYLDDTDGGSGIHTDFLGFIANTVIDSHFNDRGRLARLLGVMAKASADNAQPGILGIGLSDQTGLAVRNSQAEVIGVGSVSFLQQTPQTVVQRPAGAPLYMTNVRADMLTEGWRFNLQDKTIVSAPAGTEAVTYAGDSPANRTALSIRGDSTRSERFYALKTTYAPQSYALVPAVQRPFILNAIGINDSQNADNRGPIQETVWRALYDYPSYSGILMSAGGLISRSADNPDLLSFSRAGGSAPEAASVILDGKLVSAKGLSPYVSTADSGDGSLRAAALVNLRVHVLGQTNTWGTFYNSRTHTLQP